MHKLIRAALVLLTLQLVAACSNQQAYNSLQGARENECQKIVDATQRNQCFDNAHKPYDQFEQQRSESRNQ